MNWLSLLLVALIGASSLSLSSANSRQKRWWLWYNGYAETILGFIFAVPFNTFLPGLGPVARSLQNAEDFSDAIEFQVQPQYQEEVERVLNIFSHLGIPKLECQERLICFMSSNPNMFSPVSDLILREIEEEYGPIERNDSSLIWKYNKALRRGIISTLEECENTYKCPLSSRDILNIPVLEAWQYMTSKIRIHLV